MKTHPCSPCPLPPSPFYKLIPTWTHVKYFISPLKRGLIEKQEYHESTAYFKETDVWSHWHILLRLSLSFPLFLQLCPSFQCIHSHTLGAPAPTQPSQVPERQTTYLPFLCHPEAKKTALLPLRKWERLPKKWAKQPSTWNYEYPGTHKSHGARAQMQAERRQHKSTNTDTNHKKLQCQTNHDPISNQTPCVFCMTGTWLSEALINPPHAIPTAAQGQSPKKQGHMKSSIHFLTKIQSCWLTQTSLSEELSRG